MRGGDPTEKGASEVLAEAPSVCWLSLGSYCRRWDPAILVSKDSSQVLMQSMRLSTLKLDPGTTVNVRLEKLA